MPDSAGRKFFTRDEAARRVADAGGAAGAGGVAGAGSAAGRQFATSVKSIRYLEGSFDRHLVFDPLTTDDITFSSRGGVAPMLVGSGTGVSIHPARLDAVTVRREVLLG